MVGVSSQSVRCLAFTGVIAPEPQVSGPSQPLMATSVNILDLEYPDPTNLPLATIQHENENLWQRLSGGASSFSPTHLEWLSLII